MAKFRKKPIVVEAEQFWPDKKPWPEGVLETWNVIGSDNHRFTIETLEGPHAVKPGDWIITGVAGEKYPCKDEIFEATYEPVED